ncbi:hypothetical protein BDV25DRAFT_43055 [Aspergillus avenaceus]|uniref:Uncharacterized protein n=1 Tax=Aspergillus avenaceus TaxID=36643 RepID=A0A5N6TL36_ASPAV|nr:hypothetical protein BDV25DRAFT_43055 [Aspergillus avenaceus]
MLAPRKLHRTRCPLVQQCHVSLDDASFESALERLVCPVQNLSMSSFSEGLYQRQWPTKYPLSRNVRSCHRFFPTYKLLVLSFPPVEIFCFATVNRLYPTVEELHATGPCYYPYLEDAGPSGGKRPHILLMIQAWIMFEIEESYSVFTICI